MKSSAGNNMLKFFSFAMIAVMGLMITNKILYTHSHILASGTVYIHAHPFDKTDDSKPFKTHQHTNAEYLFFENSTVLFTLSFLFVLSLFTFKIKHSLIDRKKIYFQLLPHSNLGRSPPIH